MGGGADCPGRGGDSRRGVRGGLNKPHTDSNSSVMLVYSVCIDMSIARGLWACALVVGAVDTPLGAPPPLEGGITLICGSANFTLRPVGRCASGSELSGSDCVWDSCRRDRLRLLLEIDSSPAGRHNLEHTRYERIMFRLKKRTNKKN